MFKRRMIGLALGGGGARGLAHIGVLKVLEKNQIPIDIITGTSAGAVIGGIYAQNPSIALLERKMKVFLESKEFRRTGAGRIQKKEESENFFGQLVANIKERLVINVACSRKSIVSNERFVTALRSLIADDDVMNTKIRFGAVASDLITGRAVLFTEGNIITAILASSSIPGFLPPVESDKYKLVDGAVIHPVPVKAAYDMGADIVIAVNVTQDLTVQTEFNNIIDIMMRNSQITATAYNNLLLKDANVTIRPRVGTYHWAEFAAFRQIIRAGEKATERAIHRITSLTKKKIFSLT